jgi:hypothetical protein
MLAGKTALAFAIPIVGGYLCGWLITEGLLRRCPWRFIVGIFILFGSIALSGYI